MDRWSTQSEVFNDLGQLTDFADAEVQLSVEPDGYDIQPDQSHSSSDPAQENVLSIDKPDAISVEEEEQIFSEIAKDIHRLTPSESEGVLMVNKNRSEKLKSLNENHENACMKLEFKKPEKPVHATGTEDKSSSKSFRRNVAMASLLSKQSDANFRWEPLKNKEFSVNSKEYPPLPSK